MAKKPKQELRKITFRYPIEKFEQIEHLVKTGEYKDITEFLHSVVDGKLYLKNLIKDTDISNHKKTFEIWGNRQIEEVPDIKDEVMNILLTETQQETEEIRKRTTLIEKSLVHVKRNYIETINEFEAYVRFNKEFAEEIIERLRELAHRSENKKLLQSVNNLIIQITLSYKRADVGLLDIKTEDLEEIICPECGTVIDKWNHETKRIWFTDYTPEELELLENIILRVPTQVFLKGGRSQAKGVNEKKKKD